MADTPKTDATDVQNMRKAFEKQILELRKDITKISDSIAERSARLASEAIETASARASRAAKKLGAEAHTVSEIARENPGTTATALSAAALFGFIIGVAVGMASGSAVRRGYWT
ncbi:hypothetical protein [Mesorhizobium sp. ANAO-SY3R2]|uniref:hypothetical protein n=1 Tax=Mesorhizobium sp. ANAO-SY3R2 TaxID=3166644 RepID=UPI00366B1D5F